MVTDTSSKPTCLGNRECAQYCQVLNSLAGEEPSTDCEWPERVARADSEPSVPESDLFRGAADKLQQVLASGNAIEKSLADPNSELHVAYGAEVAIFDARMALWNGYANASKQGRSITDIEVKYYTERLQDVIEEASAKLRASGISKEAISFAQAMHDHKIMEDTGLLLDNAMVQTVTKLCANAARGTSSLVVGDKGIAKTQAAKFVSKLFSPDGKPRVMSGDGSTMKDEFIGQVTLTEKNGVTVTGFQDGVLVECAEQGIPVVMDEINLMDPTIAMRLQDILLCKPGQEITIQEDGGRKVVIKTGFCVIATANEASEGRYQRRAEFDPAFRDRFSVVPVEYPDSETDILRQDQLPSSLIRLAYTQVVSRNGLSSARVSAEDASWLARVAHASQQLYSKPAKDVRGSLTNNVASVVDDTEPRMSDCITPRAMLRILETVNAGLNPYDVAAGVRGLTMDTIGAMRSPEDRHTMLEVLRLLHEPKKYGDFDEQATKQRMRLG
ncbi:hypothetical protein CSA80_01205 [Candidatus Saccharibacteria bacterium]|nr:MAG: hypothetical protein CR973_01950 [Candidatus Saccharibacteria bacterium]PID99365.1 MAG: hypothetical protein CSA80_01205 [Candidatus Saccharibacteria bacterium]